MPNLPISRASYTSIRLCNKLFTRRFSALALAALLLAGTATISTGCAANKCDCPRFGGHRLSH